MIKYLTFLLGFLPMENFAQSFDLGSWNIVDVKYKINNKWGVFGEAQLRSLHFYTHFNYYEYKAGVNFKAHKNISLAVGAGSHQTYKEGGDFVLPKNKDEFRIWPQVSISQSINNLKIEHRYRSEHRFTSDGHQNRFRLRLALSYPFGKETNGFKPFKISGSNELFFTDRASYFERNRMLFALSYKPSGNTSLQLGYLHQFDYEINDETGRDFLLIGYYYEI